MVRNLEQNVREAASRGKYRVLYRYLRELSTREWKTSFSEVETMLGFKLPASARLYSAWWANEEPGGRHTNARAWTAVGWKTSDVNIESATLAFTRKSWVSGAGVGDRPKIDLDEEFPVHNARDWSECPSLRREDMYSERISPQPYLPHEDLDVFFRECDLRHGSDPEPEPDWEEHLAAIEKSRR